MSQSGGSDAGPIESFLVKQGNQQYSLEPFGTGETIEEFYRYGADGHAHSNLQIPLTQSNTSILFFWTGPEGISLVTIHDKPHDIQGGGEVTFGFENLPDDGDWVVRDDNPGNDTFSKTQIDWVWIKINTDGAAFRGGLTDVEEIGVRPEFREGINEWQLLTGDINDPTRISLSLDEPIRISPGSVGDSLSSTLDELDDQFGDSVDTGAGESISTARGQLMRNLVKMADNLAVLIGEGGTIQRDVAQVATSSLQTLIDSDMDLGPRATDLSSGLATALVEHDQALQEVDPQIASALQFDENFLTRNVVPASKQLLRYMSQSSDIYFSDRQTAKTRYSSAHSQSRTLYQRYLSAQAVVAGLSGNGDGTGRLTGQPEAVPTATPETLRHIDRLLMSYNRTLSFAARLLFTDTVDYPLGGRLDARVYGGERVGSARIEDNVRLIYREVPGRPPDSYAYTDLNGTLLEPNQAVDVAIAHVLSESYAFDSRDRLEMVREHKREFENIEDMARVANILAELSGAIALAKIDPIGAVSRVVGAVEGVVNWAEYEIDNPYREQFAKIAATSGTLQWADREVPNPNGSLLSLSEEALEIGQLGVDAVGLADDLRDLSVAASTVRDVYRQADSIRTNIPTGQVDGIDDLRSTSYTAAASLAVDTAVSGVTNIAESQARQGALGAGSAGAREPILNEIVSIEQQLNSLGVGPMGILRLQSLKQTEYYMAAATWSGIGAMQRSLSEGTLGVTYDVLFEADELAETASETAKNYRDLGDFTTIQTGRAFERGLDRYETSVNADRFGEQTVLNNQ